MGPVIIIFQMKKYKTEIINSGLRDWNLFFLVPRPMMYFSTCASLDGPAMSSARNLALVFTLGARPRGVSSR